MDYYRCSEVTNSLYLYLCRPEDSGLSVVRVSRSLLLSIQFHVTTYFLLILLVYAS